jgi:flagellar basal-body rod modification protein FlgD
MTTAVNNNSVSQTLLDNMNPQGTSTQSAADAQQNQFLTLLVTQMQNQDPLNPMDNAEVTSQLAQLSTVTGIDQVNTTLQSLMGSYQSSQSLQSANLIGHGVLAAGSSISLASGQAIFGVNLPTAADDVTVSIKDSTGKQVASLDMGKQSAGTQSMAWDGTDSSGAKLPDGTYTFSVQATVAGTAVDATPLQFGVVGTVTTAAGQNAQVNVPGLGAVDVNNIYQVL